MAFDLESHNDLESLAANKTSMWLGCLIDEKSEWTDESIYSYTMNEFLSQLELLSLNDRLCIYIYNLSFEWSFIFPVLFKLGYQYKDVIKEDDEKVFNSVTTKSASSVWSAEVKFGKKNKIVMFRDLSKLYPGGLAKVAKALKLPTQKGEIDYRLNRLHGHVVTNEERFYCFKDTKIVMDILCKMDEDNDKDFFASLSSSSYSMRNLLKWGWPRSTKPYQEYRKIYPCLPKAQDDFLREGVEGGLTTAPEQWQFKEIEGPILHIDAHQMHPTQMATKLFPYGVGTYFKGRPPHPFSKMAVVRIRISYDSVRLHSIIKLIGLSMVEDMEIVVWSFEIPTMYKCYVNLKVEYIEGYEYSCRPLPWRKMYPYNYTQRKKLRAEGNEFLATKYKQWNNGSYGKLLEKPHNQWIVNTINKVQGNVIDSILVDKAPTEIKVQSKYTYLPAGSAVPAYSRVCLIETALKFGWQYILYMDTDSLFIILNKRTRAVWESGLINKADELGGWGEVEIIDKAQFVAPKRYKLLVGDEVIAKMAGINYDEGVEFPFEELNLLDSTWQVRRAFKAEGGTLIDFQEKKMSIQDKYKDIYTKNIEKKAAQV